MNRSDRMKPIKRHADTRERDAGSVLAKARALVDERERQLLELSRYREEYAGRQTNAIGSVDPMRLQNYHAFLARLQDAVRQQQQLVDEARAELERRMTEWQATRAEAAALGRVVERLEDGERRESDRREQQDHDERALRSPGSSIVRE
jgi:flagellar protein FliJ